MTKKATLYVRTDDGRLWVQQQAVMPFLVATIDAIPLTFFGTKRNPMAGPPYMEIDAAIVWLEKEAAKNHSAKATAGYLEKVRILREQKALKAQTTEVAP